MGIAISSVLVKQITDHAAASLHEVCGLLLGETDRVIEVRACANVALEPERRFEIDPAALIAAHRAARAGGPQVLGHYHSHPGGAAVPSPRDAETAAADGALWLIVGSGQVRGWRAVEKGAVEGRFDLVGLEQCGEDR